MVEYWIVDTEAGAIEVLRDPAPEGYRSTQRIARGAFFDPTPFPDLVLSVWDVLG